MSNPLFKIGDVVSFQNTEQDLGYLTHTHKMAGSVAESFCRKFIRSHDNGCIVEVNDPAREFGIYYTFKSDGIKIYVPEEYCYIPKPIPIIIEEEISAVNNLVKELDNDGQ